MAPGQRGCQLASKSGDAAGVPEHSPSRPPDFDVSIEHGAPSRTFTQVVGDLNSYEAKLALLADREALFWQRRIDTGDPDFQFVKGIHQRCIKDALNDKGLPCDFDQVRCWPSLHTVSTSCMSPPHGHLDCGH